MDGSVVGTMCTRNSGLLSFGWTHHLSISREYGYPAWDILQRYILQAYHLLPYNSPCYYHAAKYYEPYYLLLSNPASMKYNSISVAQHTIPFFIPVQEMVDTFLPHDMEVSFPYTWEASNTHLLFSRLYYGYFMCFYLRMYRDESRWKNSASIAKSEPPLLAFLLRERRKIISS